MLPTIVLTGRKFCGKDTLTKAVLSMGYSRLSFSDQLKRICSELFPWLNFDYPQGEKDTKQFNGGTLSPRDIWLKMNVVTEIDRFILVRSLYNQMSELHPHRKCIITDLRKPEEYEWVKENCLPIVKIIDGSGRYDVTEDPLEDFIDSIEPDYIIVNNKDSESIDRFKLLVEQIENDHNIFRHRCSN